MTAPLAPAVIAFQPWPTLAVVAGERYVDASPHTDTGVRIWTTGTTETMIVDSTIGAPTQSPRITGLSLNAGATYRARIRYQNATGWSPWSENFFSRAPIKISSFVPLSVPDEPTYGGALNEEPDYVLPLNFDRPVLQWRMETGHVVRRPEHSTQRPWVQFIWLSRTAAQKATIENFITARINAAESFSIPSPGSTIAGSDSLEWFARRGTLRVTLLNKVYRISVDADEIIRDRVFTIGVSKIGGSDPIRAG